MNRLEVVTVECFHDELVVTAIVFDFVEASELNVEDDPLVLVWEVLDFGGY